MTTSRPATRFALQHHHPGTVVTLVTLYWAMAAILVSVARLAIEPRWPSTGSMATFAAVIVTAYAYSRFATDQAGITHALGVGIAWLSLSITMEIALTIKVGHSWFTLLGSPDQTLFHKTLIFVWIFAPALFARRRSCS